MPVPLLLGTRSIITPSKVSVYLPFPSDCIGIVDPCAGLPIATEGLDCQFETVAVTTVPLATKYVL
jgi:hypothetical protein